MARDVVKHLLRTLAAAGVNLPDGLLRSLLAAYQREAEDAVADSYAVSHHQRPGVRPARGGAQRPGVPGRPARLHRGVPAGPPRSAPRAQLGAGVGGRARGQRAPSRGGGGGAGVDAVRGDRPHPWGQARRRVGVGGRREGPPRRHRPGRHPPRRDDLRGGAGSGGAPAPGRGGGRSRARQQQDAGGDGGPGVLPSGRPARGPRGRERGRPPAPSVRGRARDDGARRAAPGARGRPGRDRLGGGGAAAGFSALSPGDLAAPHRPRPGRGAARRRRASTTSPSSSSRATWAASPPPWRAGACVCTAGAASST